MKNIKIVLNCIVRNESKVIERMLESVYKHIDYWVIQDNGSDDGTQDIIKKFFEKNKIPGFLYHEPWQFPGYNRNHSLQTCLQSNHGCDYVLRMDADEILEVDQDFDWEIIKSKDSWNIACQQVNWNYYRNGLWRANLPWAFRENKRHELIYLKNDQPYSQDNLPDLMKYVLMGGGKTWENPYKYFIDAIELEKQVTTEGKNYQNPFDWYHLFYLAKSFRDCLPASSFCFGEEHKINIGERGKFYFNQFIKKFQPNYPKITEKLNKTQNDYFYFALFQIALIDSECNQVEKAIENYKKAFEFDPRRNEALIELCSLYFFNKNDIVNTYLYSSIAIKNKYPFPKLRESWIDKSTYVDTGWKALDFHSISAYHMGYFDECKQSCEILLSKEYKNILPQEQKIRVIENLNFANAELKNLNNL